MSWSLSGLAKSKEQAVEQVRKVSAQAGTMPTAYADALVAQIEALPEGAVSIETSGHISAPTQSYDNATATIKHVRFFPEE